MKNNKFLKGLIFIIALFTVGVSTNYVANAATWHKGTPSALHGTWETTRIKKDGYQSSNGRTVIKKNSIYSTHRFAPINPDSVDALSYKKTGSNSYTVKGTYHNNGVGSTQYQFKIYSKDKIYFSGNRSGKFGDAATYYRK